MGNSLSSSDDNILTPPPNYTTPSFPSLYDPALELGSGNDGAPIPGVSYLYYSIGEQAISEVGPNGTDDPT